MPEGVIFPNVISFSSHLVVFQEVVSACNTVRLQGLARETKQVR